MKSWYDEKPAKGTPIKFTKSLPAKAVARANVPHSTMTRNTFTFSTWSSCISTADPTKVQPSNSVMLSWM